MSTPEQNPRPLSPHLTVYRPQINSITSILHRITGVGLVPGAVLVVWWLLAASSGDEYYQFVDSVLLSWPGRLVLIGSLWALCYHFCTGIRHLIWDTGAGYSIRDINLSGWVVVAASLVMTALVLMATAL